MKYDKLKIPLNINSFKITEHLEFFKNLKMYEIDSVRKFMMSLKIF
jgi:hypothetical protein